MQLPDFTILLGQGTFRAGLSFSIEDELMLMGMNRYVLLGDKKFQVY